MTMTVMRERSSSTWSLGSRPTPLLKRKRKGSGSTDQVRRSWHRCSDEINKKDDLGRSLLFYAAQFDQPEVAIQLLEAGCDPNVEDYQGKTALHEAVQIGSCDVARVLIKNGNCDVNTKTKDGVTPLMIAVEKDYIEIVKLLQKSGARLDELDHLGRSALLVGLAKGAEKSCLQLVKAGCDVNLVDTEGHSALYFATYRTKLTSLELAKKLMKSGYKARKDADWLKEGRESEGCLFKLDNKFFQHVLSKAGIKSKHLEPELVKTIKITYFHKVFHRQSSKPSGDKKC